MMEREGKIILVFIILLVIAILAGLSYLVLKMSPHQSNYNSSQSKSPAHINTTNDIVVNENMLARDIVKCDSSTVATDPEKSLNIFFVGAGYSQDQLFCKDKCNLTDFSKILENDIYLLLYSENKTQGFGLLTIEPFNQNINKIKIYVLTSTMDCDYKTDPYCFFNFKDQIGRSCPAYNPNDHIYILIGYDDPESFHLGGGSPHYSASHRIGLHEFENIAPTFVHELGHSLGLHDLYSRAYQPWAPQEMANSSAIPNCDNTPGCPKWCKGKPLPPFQIDCSKYLSEETCMAHSVEDSCLWLKEEDPYFKSKCIKNEDIPNNNIGTDCVEGTGCYWGCDMAGFRPVSQNNFANQFSERIDSSGKKHTYEPISEKFVSDIFSCCYPQTCSNYNLEYCKEFSKTYPSYSSCGTC